MADHPQVEVPSAPFEPLAQEIDTHGQSLGFDPSGGDTVPPTIGNFAPTPGTPLQRNTAVSFDVLDLSGLLRVEVSVTLGGDRFVVHDGDTFVGQYVNLSTRSPIVDGFRFNVRHNGGWIEPPTFRVHAVDTSGNEAS